LPHYSYARLRPPGPADWAKRLERAHMLSVAAEEDVAVVVASVVRSRGETSDLARGLPHASNHRSIASDATLGETIAIGRVLRHPVLWKRRSGIEARA